MATTTTTQIASEDLPSTSSATTSIPISEAAAAAAAQPPTPATTTKDKFAFLRALTSAEEYHGEKTFYQHLVNVHDYLQSQNLPQPVCDAGLFHSVYGTEFYHFSSAAITRDVVRGYVGDYAEELAHIFCGLRKDRFGAILNNKGAWDAQRHLDLCRLEHANFWDGRNDRDVKRQMELLEEKIAALESEIKG